MAIYSRFGEVVTVVRVGTLDDVRTLDRRKPDKDDKQNVQNGCYVVTKFAGGTEQLASFAYLRADDGLKEIMDACRALPEGKRHPSWT